jgi:Protein of unknown function (DUF3800)
MYLAYIDESGNVGDFGKGGTLTFTLACVLVEASVWSDVFDQTIDFRRFLRDAFGLPVRAEVKANYLLRNSGPFAALKLTEQKRFKIYRGFMRLQHKLDLDTFAILVNKTKMPKGTDPRLRTWEFMLQRLERFSTKSVEPVLIIHDEGEGHLIKTWARKSRRAGSAGSMFGTGSLKRPFRTLLDDPTPRNSAHSYFVQLADLNAYAAFRRFFPPSAKITQIVPSATWDELKTARYAPANALSGGPQGIVSWP